MRAGGKLTVRGIAALPEGKHCDGAGLWLVKRDDGGGQWVLRVTVYGRRREMGLGSLADVSLREARDAADRARAVVRSGKDPIREREKDREDGIRNMHRLADIARDAFEARNAELKGDGVNGRWFSPLELHVLPKLGKVPVSEINQRDIRDTLAPIWHDKADTARKALNRLSICLRHAAALGLDVDLQATEKAKALLGKTRHKPEHIPAMSWQDVPAFYASLSDGSVTHLALRLLILTAARSRPLRFMQESEIDGDIWTIPGEGMKGRRDATRDFRVPLSSEARAVIAEARTVAVGGFLFPNVRGRGVISDMTLARHMERLGLEARPHGFRTSLRTWLAETTDVSREVAEKILSHTVGTAVERAYQRSDLIEQRRVFMERWGRFVAGGSGTLVQLVPSGGERARKDA